MAENRWQGALKEPRQTYRCGLLIPIDAFFLHIQGSGRIRLPNKNVLRVGFAGHNRHPYTAIGRVLVRRGAIERKAVSMQSIRAWLSAHPTARPGGHATERALRLLPAIDRGGTLSALRVLR